MNVYVVTASQGEYSDRSEWPVAAYEEESMAQQHVIAATRAEKARQALGDGSDVLCLAKDAQLLAILKPWDPGGVSIDSLDFGRLYERSYRIDTVPLLAALPGNPETAAEEAAEKMRELIRRIEP